MLKIQRPKIHDNTDADLIVINKTKLAYTLELVRRFCSSVNNVLAWLGLGITFLLTSLITEAFKQVGAIPGETIRAVFTALGIVSLGLCVKAIFNWYKLKNKYDPDALVLDLLNSEPQELETLEIKSKSENKILTSLAKKKRI